MTTSAFPFLDGRSALSGPVAQAPRRRTWHPGLALDHVPLRFRRHDSSSVDWADALARHAQR